MMDLPYAEHAYVPPRKLTGYLLSTTHTAGKGKANFFRDVGFNEENTDLFTQGLLAIAQNGQVVNVMETDFGRKFVIDGLLLTLTKGLVQIHTVWIIETEEIYPRFVTAYPRTA